MKFTPDNLGNNKLNKPTKYILSKYFRNTNNATRKITFSKL